MLKNKEMNKKKNIFPKKVQVGGQEISRNEKFVTTFSGFLTEAMRSMK